MPSTREYARYYHNLMDWGSHAIPLESLILGNRIRTQIVCTRVDSDKTKSLACFTKDNTGSSILLPPRVFIELLTICTPFYVVSTTDKTIQVINLELYMNMQLAERHNIPIEALIPDNLKRFAWLCTGFSPENALDKLAYEIKKKLGYKPGYVYLLQAGPFYKIGRSRNVTKRIEQLSTLPPFDLELICIIETDDMVGLEKRLHEQFADKHKNGEWFELTGQDVEIIKAHKGAKKP